MRPTVLLRLLVFSGFIPNTCPYYPTALRRVQITSKMSSNITLYLYSRGLVRQTLHVQSGHGKVICGADQYTVTNGSFLYCLSCDTCHAGYGLYPWCGQTVPYPPNNIGCKACPNETFSDKLDSAPCYSCQQCAMLEIVAAPCTRFSDRICNGTCEKGYFFSKKVPHSCQQCSYCCFDGKDDEQPECVKQGLNATARHCSARLDKHCVPHLSSSTAAVTTQTRRPSLTQSPTSLKLTSSSPSQSTSPSTTTVTDKKTPVTHLPATHSPDLLATLTSSMSHPTNPQVGNHPAVVASSVLSGLALAAMIVAAMFYMYKKKKKQILRTQNIPSDRSPGNCDNNPIQVLPQGDVAYRPGPRVQELQNNTGYAASSASETPEQTDDEDFVDDLPDVTAERNKRLLKRQSSKEPQSNVQKKDGTTESLDPSEHVQAVNQGEDSKGVGQSMPRRPSFEALKRKLSLSRDYQPLRQEDPDESREGTCEAKEKIPEDLLVIEMKQNASQENTRLSTDVEDLPYPVRGKVCRLLNIKRDTDFDDFRMLAEKAGLEKDKIRSVEQTENSPTDAILKEWSIKSREATVGKLIEMLKAKDFERMDVVKVLEDWVYDHENHVFFTL